MKEGKEVSKIIVEEIISSYELKVRTVSSLITRVIQKVKSFQGEQIQLAERLKDILAKNQNLRRKDFDNMIANIRAQNTQRENEVTRMVQDFCKEEEENIAELREILTGNSPRALENFNILKKRMLNRPKEREKMLTRMLKNFHRDQEEMTAALKKLLKKGPAVRIKDLRAMIKAFHIAHHDEVSGVDEILEEFERVKDEIGNKWQRVMATVNKGDYRVSLEGP